MYSRAAARAKLASTEGILVIDELVFRKHQTVRSSQRKKRITNGMRRRSGMGV
jgi:hypothetical protein